MLSFAELGNSQMNKASFSAPKSITSLEVRNSEKGERPRFAFEPTKPEDTNEKV